VGLGFSGVLELDVGQATCAGKSPDWFTPAGSERGRFCRQAPPILRSGSGPVSLELQLALLAESDKGLAAVPGAEQQHVFVHGQVDALPDRRAASVENFLNARQGVYELVKQYCLKKIGAEYES